MKRRKTAVRSAPTTVQRKSAIASSAKKVSLELSTAASSTVTSKAVSPMSFGGYDAGTETPATSFDSADGGAEGEGGDIKTRLRTTAESFKGKEKEMPDSDGGEISDLSEPLSELESEPESEASEFVKPTRSKKDKGKSIPPSDAKDSDFTISETESEYQQDSEEEEEEGGFATPAGVTMTTVAVPPPPAARRRAGRNPRPSRRNNIIRMTRVSSIHGLVFAY